MFESYFGFVKTPFSKDIAPSAIYENDSLLEALARLSYAVERKLICTLTAEIGMGKSLAIRKLVSSLDQSRHTCIYLSNPTIGARGILSDIVATFSEEPCFFKSKLIRQAKDAIESEAARGKTIVVLIDEAHILTTDALEEIRLLTNFDMDSSQKFTLILSGQPPLAKKLRFYTLAAFEQRISLKVRLKPFNLQETAAYIKHHLNLCGRPDALFSDDAIALIHKSCQGAPRRINNLSLQALMAGYLEKKSIIDEATAKRAVAEVESE
jgi:type II secretory pathway predicted ATPase ExeA